jgi:thiamine pyrophosphate-dependent acetolactate synthase large subunit-like protein
LIRKEAINIVAEKIGDQPIISANGFISRDLFEVCDKNSNFYMIGSMGLASSIGLGLALQNPKKMIYVFDGDGNILMNLGSLTTISKLKPKNFIHIIFDNSSHESTGGQPTSTNKISIDAIAKAVNFKVFRCNSKKNLDETFKKIKNIAGPIIILMKISKSEKISGRISLPPKKIKSRFMKSF